MPDGLDRNRHGSGMPVAVGALGAGELRELDQADGDAAGPSAAAARSPDTPKVTLSQ